MSAEHHGEGGERHTTAVSAELDKSRLDQLAKLKTTPEVDRADERADAAREAIKELDKQDPLPEEPGAPEASAPQTVRIPFLDHKLNYRQTLASVQRRLKPASRQFSRVIHTPVVEKTSEALEHTIARPSVLLGATWTALIVGSLFYFTARHYGYALAGSELLFSFIVGAVLGVIIEALWHALRRR